MKKLKLILILLTAILLVTGCSKNEEKNQKEEKTEIKEETKEMQEVEVKAPEYIDNNTTPISFYSLQGNKLVKLTEISKRLNVEEDIGIFQIYPSNENEIYLNKSFAESFYDEWQKYNQNNNIKIGFNIKFNLANQEISYNIFSPTETFDKWEYLMNYLYDDYANRGKGFYSHIEENQYNEQTLFTALKIQSSYQCSEIISPIQVTVFTYDSDDDFENNEYRGNSKQTFTINIEK